MTDRRIDLAIERHDLWVAMVTFFLLLVAGTILVLLR
jgi:hypothetical protein